jgi:hypothetical protein
MVDEVWLERWEATDAGVGSRLSTDGIVFGYFPIIFGRFPRLDGGARYVARATLAVAAPDLARALLKVEFSNQDDVDCCPECGFSQAESARPSLFDASSTGHRPADVADDVGRRGCSIDAALTKAGFSTAESRDAARAAVEKAGL